jgi:hypothetical protein
MIGEPRDERDFENLSLVECLETEALSDLEKLKLLSRKTDKSGTLLKSIAEESQITLD